MSKRAISREILEELYVRQGLSGRDVARRLGCAKKTIYRELARHGIPQHTPAMIGDILRAKVSLRDNIGEGTLRQMYEEEQLSVNRIAERLSVSPSTITRRMDELDIPRRSRPEASKIATADVRVDIPESALRSLYDEGFSARAIGARFGVSENLIFRRLDEHGIETRSASEASIRYPKTDFNGNPLEKAYLIGFRLGDLWVGRQNPDGATISITCSSSKQAQIDLIASLFRDYGRVCIGKPNEEGHISVAALVNDSFTFLLPKKESIEPWIMANVECFWAFLAGYVDAEGNIGIYDGKARLRVTTTDKRIICQIWERLSGIGLIIPRPRHIPMKGKPLRRTVRKGKANKDQWELATNRKATLLHILTHIMPCLKHADRLRRCHEAMANIEQRNRR